MQLNINLATQPYQDVRRYVLRRGVPLLIFALLSTWFCWHTFRTWTHSRDVNAQISRVQSEIRMLDQERANAEAVLNKPENRSTVEKARELNAMIAEKAFSWTGVFMQLEKIMPSQLRVVQITPEINRANQLTLRLVVSGTNREQALELVRRLERSAYFTNAQLRAETMQPDGVQFEIATLVATRSSEAVPSEQQNNTDSTETKPSSTAENVNVGRVAQR